MLVSSEVMMKRPLRIFLAVFLLSFLVCGPVWAQQVSGTQISGVVKDSSGGVLPGAEVTVKKTDTGMIRTVFTGSDGSYTLPNLPVGPYELKVVLQGFNTYVKTGIVLQVNTNPTLDVTMGVGTLDETVTVTADAMTVETKSTGVGTVINNQTVVEMPLNGRQATELIFLSGLSTPAPAGDLNTNKNYPTVTISVAGGQANGMTYIMDGGTHNDPFNNLNLPTLFPDALQEFKVESSALPARYGHHAASAVNIVTKSGTNTVKGNVFEFLRDYHFNARNAFATTRDNLKRNQFGGTIGAPIKKDKVFFFGAYQGKIEKTTPPTTTVFAPTQAMLNGDFTAFASAACNSTGAKTLKAPYVNNTIDPKTFNPVALALLKYVPVATDPCGKIVMGIPGDNTEHQMLSKVDYNISQSQTLTARYMYAHYDLPSVYDGKNVLTMSRTGQTNTVHSFVVGHNWVLSSTSVNALHVTFNKTINDRTMEAYFTPKELGSNVFSPQPGFTNLSVTGGFSIGTGGTNPGFFNSKGFQIADDFDLIKGKHQFSAGVNWIHTSIETVNNRPTNGGFSINGTVTGLGLADLMVGAMGGAFVQGNAVWDFDHNDYFGTYVQDDWKIRPNFTFNFGRPVRRRREEHGVSAGACGPAVRRRHRHAGQAGHEQPVDAVRASHGHDLVPGDRRQDEREGRVRHVLRHAAPVLQHALGEQPAVGRPGQRRQHRHQWADRSLDGLPGRQPVAGTRDGVGNAAVPGVRRLRERAARHQEHGPASVEHQRPAPVRRLALRRQLPRQPHEPLVDRRRAESRRLHGRRNHGQHEPAPDALPEEPGRRAVLRHHRATG
ncbi:MAG: carboxypeptidase-like regulatory domain-containing protein [Acidobacteria bacterium]|nr:carboxypeptidase-like regulatory domain-containing protein [Acidobacteriota bacterium]